MTDDAPELKPQMRIRRHERPPASLHTRLVDAVAYGCMMAKEFAAYFGVSETQFNAWRANDPYIDVIIEREKLTDLHPVKAAMRTSAIKGHHQSAKTYTGMQQPELIAQDRAEVSVTVSTRVLPKPTETIDWKVEATEAEFEELESENRTPVFRDKPHVPSGKKSSGITSKQIKRR